MLTVEQSADFEESTGLKLKVVDELRRIIFTRDSVSDAILFDPRATGKWKNFSDIDICLTGEEIAHDDIVWIMNALDDTLLPYSIDIIRFSSITNQDLRDHVLRVGISLKK